jgi:ABC-2 type transport system permease protein/lipopolysaccharide transport system permease protein
MDAQSNAGRAALDQAARKRSRVVQAIDPAFPGVRGLRDLWQGWRDYRELWVTVGIYDIRKRYRRSLLGPFWITISLGAFILGLSFIYSPLVGGESGSFLPYVAFGFVAWQFVSQLVLDGCTVFISNGLIIQQLEAPLSVYIYQTIWRHLIIFAHNLLIYVLIALICGLWPSWQTLLVVPGIILVSINGMSIGMLFGTLCARFRDIPPIVQTITQMMFLLTPILWRPDQVPGRELFYLLNPFYYLVQIIRGPLEGEAPPLFIWTVVLTITAVGFVVSLLFFSRFRNRIVYWL